MSAREHILSRLKQTQISIAPPLPDVARWFEGRQRNESMLERKARLKTALEAVHTEIHEVTPANWTATLVELAKQKGIGQVLIGTGTPHGAQLQATDCPDLKLIEYTQPIDTWRDLLFDGVDAALTLAMGAVAETGSLILWPTPSEPRLMSLVPSVHFVLLDVEHIHSDLFSAMNANHWENAMPTNALLICGPSKTADIQQTLAYGAHGPKELIVLLRQSTGDQS